MKWKVFDDDSGGFFVKCWHVQALDRFSKLYDLIPRGIDDNHLPVELVGGPGQTHLDTNLNAASMDLSTDVFPPRGFSSLFAKRLMPVSWTYKFVGSPIRIDGAGDEAEVIHSKYALRVVQLFIEPSPTRKVDESSLKFVRFRCDFEDNSEHGQLPSMEGRNPERITINPRSIFQKAAVIPTESGGECIVVGYILPALRIVPVKGSKAKIIKGYRDVLSWKWKD